MAALGQWSGSYLGGWAGGSGVPSGFIDAALFAEGIGFAQFSAVVSGRVDHYRGGSIGRGFVAEKPRKKRRDDNECFILLMM